MINKKNIKKLLPILSSVLVFLLAYNSWIFSNQILTNGDWMFFFKETMSTLRIYYFSTWLGDGLGRFLIDASQAPTYIIYGVLAKYLNFDFSLSERLVYMWPILIFETIGLFFLLNHFFKNRIAVFVGIIVYMFNTFMLQYETGFLTLSVAIALAPLVMFLFIKLLEKQNFKWLCLVVLIGYIQSSYEFRAFYVMSIVLFLYLIFFVFIIKNNHKIKSLSFGLLFFVLICVLNLFWLLPLYLTGELSQNNILARGLFGNNYLNINYALTLFHPFWTGSKPKIFIIQPIPLYFWFISFFAFSGLYFNRKNKNIIFFGIVVLIGVLLTKQVGQPFSEIYLWLYGHLPGFSAFREASKFYFLIALGYAILIGFFIDYIWENWKNNKLQIYGKYLLTFLIAIIFLWNAKPLATGDIGTLFVARHIPNDYIKVKNFILKQNNYSRTLWIPVDSRWSIYTNNHPILSMAVLIDSDWNNLFIRSNNNNYIFGGISYINFLKQKDILNLLSNSSIRYVFVPLEDEINDDDFFFNFMESKQYYVNQLNKIGYLHKIDIGTKDVVIYENYDYKPHIYITNNQESISKNQPFTKIDYEFINPTEYKATLKNISKPIYLNFSESFNSGWKIRIGNFSWFNVLTNKNYFISDKYHFKNDATLNSFYIDPSIVCKIESCNLNKDGSYDMDLTLYFASQSYMYLGLIISGATLVVILSYLFFAAFGEPRPWRVLGRNLYERKNK